MKKTKIIALAFAFSFGLINVGHGQILRELVKDAGKQVNNYKGKTKTNTKSKSGITLPLSEGEVSDGLKQALQIGAQNATGKVSAVNGFFGNALIKVLMPPETKKVENTLRQIGLGDHVDKAILTMNRAAEDASKQAVPIFIEAIKGMSITDAISILKGNKDAATQYLKSKTTAQLTKTFRPVIEESLDKYNATKYWADVFNVYNDLPTTFKKVNSDLPGYVTEKALNGLFIYIADEEAKIRNNPASRVTDLLKKVFG